MNEQEFVNDTELLEQPFGHPPIHYFVIFAAVSLILCIITYVVSTAAEIFLLCTICRFKRLKTRTNMYILNCCICNILANIISPIFLILGPCAFFKTRNMFMTLNLIFAFALAVDWFTSCCKPNFITFYQKYYKYVFLAIYVLMLLEYILSVYIGCQYWQYYRFIDEAYDFFLSILYTLLLVFLMVMNFLKKKVCSRPDSFKTAYALTTSNIIIFSLFPKFLLYIIYGLIELRIYIPLFEFILLVGILFSAGYPVLMVYMLGKQSTHFKMSYDQSFKRNIGNYSSEIVDAEYCVEGDSVQVNN